MSGLEILGIAASILQIADLGTTVSVKLCTFYRQLKAADQAAQSLSSEVALTCSILRQLGENLKADETTRLYSAQAFETAQEVLRECEKVFRRISGAIDESRGEATKNAIQRAARRLGFVLMERELDVLRGNLERLKSTMLLLLNVIMYAGQVRSRAESSVLQEQRDLIRVLVEEKKASERRLDELRRSDELVKALDSLDVNHSQGSAVQDTLPPYESLAQEDVFRELRTYHQLVKRLLQEVDACKSGIERSRYSRIRNGVFRVHATEVRQFQQAHGAMVARLFEDPLFSLAPESSAGSDSSQEDLKKTNKEPDARPKGILKPPRDKFPEEPNPVREGVAALKDTHKTGITPGARWTKIDIRLVDPAAHEAGNERYEERPDVIDTQNDEDKTEEAEKRRREAIVRVRRAEEYARRYRSFSPQSNERDRIPLQPSGFIDPSDLQIEHSPTERFRARDRMNVYLPHSRTAYDGIRARPPGIGYVDNDSRNQGTNRRGYKSRRQRQEDTTMVDIEREDETILRKHRRPLASTSVPREASPRHQRDYDLHARQDPELRKHQMEIEQLDRELARHRREHDNEGIIVDTESKDETILQNHRRPRREASPRYQRDYDLPAEQRILEKNDARQDLELMKEKMEIERLERVPARRRGEHENKGITEVISARTGPHGTRQQINHIARQQQSAPGSVIVQSDIYEADVDAIPVPTTKTEQVKEAVDAVDDLLLKWTTLGQDDLLA